MEKNILIAQERALLLERSDENTDVFVISDESVDNHGTSFEVGGWDLSYSKRNGVVTYGHPDLDSTDDTLYIGKSEVYIEDGKLKARVEYNQDNPRALRIQKAVKNGFIKMASIRAYIHDAKWGEPGTDKADVLIYTRQSLFDWGIVPHGSNQNAYAQRSAIAEKLGIARTIDPPTDTPTPLPTEEEIEKPEPIDMSEEVSRIGKAILKIKKIKK